MELQTSSQVSKLFGVSTRMLRYYEQAGLIKGLRKEGYPYRVYDDENIKRLQQVIILRKLQIPIKQISVILSSPNAAAALEVFKANISKVETEISALSTIKSALEIFVAKMEEIASIQLNLNLLTDDSVLKLAESLSLVQKNIKERMNMEELNQATKELEKLTDRDVRIVYLPPATVAAVHFISDDEQGRIPEEQGGDITSAFIENLAKIKPDFRHYGFNHDVNGKHGYEHWYTIPDDMEVSAPFAKKQFAGGIYGAYTLKDWDGEFLVEWANNHDKYEFAQGSSETMLGILEEHLNEMGRYVLPNVKHEIQIDLLIPLREKRTVPDSFGYIADSETKCGFKASLIEKKTFKIVGHLYTPPNASDREMFYKELVGSEQFALMKSALKPDAPILVYHHYDSVYKIMVCTDIKNAADKKYFESDDIKTKSIRKKMWIQFDMTTGDMKENLNFDKWNPHKLVNDLGYKFDGSAGFFVVYQCRELLVTEENKNEPFYCWMPVVSL